MNENEFPQVTGIDVDVVIRLNIDGKEKMAFLKSTDDFVNEACSNLFTIGLLMKDQQTIFGKFDQVIDVKGDLYVILRSAVNPKCIIAIPFDDIVGYFEI